MIPEQDELTENLVQALLARADVVIDPSSNLLRCIGLRMALSRHALMSALRLLSGAKRTSGIYEYAA
jgi:hypothetical protein